jgi:acetyltransferase-like isoleucine patch superfamily enzyme
MQFVSARARVKGFLEGENVVLGPSTIGTDSLIGRNVILGYPVRKSLQNFTFSKEFSIEKFDKVSRGSKIGRNCTVRSGTIIYETADVNDEVETGHNVLIREGSTIGSRTRIGSSAQLDGCVKIGEDVSIQSNVYLPHLTVIQDNVFLAPNVVFTNDPYPPSERRVGITVERNAVIGANAIVLPRVRVGAGSVVAAGTIVTKDVPPNKVVVGIPARVYSTRDAYDKKMRTWEKAR